MADHRLVTHVPPHAATHISGPHPSQGTQDVNVPIADALGTSAYTSEHVVNDRWGESLIDKESIFEYLNMMKKILYGAHSNVAMGLGWRAAGCVTKL